MYKIFFVLFSYLATTLSAGENYSIKKLPPIIISTPIKAKAQDVWNVMVDFKNYGQWNQWVVKLEGEAKIGSTVKAYAESGKSLDLKITIMQEPRRLCWEDVTWFTLLGVGGWRCRTIEDNPDGEGVIFTNHFEFTGFFGWVLRSLTLEYLEKGMTLENENLRDFIELKNLSH